MSVSNYLASPAYIKLISDFLIEKKPHPDKQQKIYKQIEESKNIHFSNIAGFKEKVLSQIYNLCALKAGRRVFKIILQSNHQLIFGFKKNTCGINRVMHETLSIIYYDESGKSYNIRLNEKGEKTFYLTPREIDLGHELCHLVNKIIYKDKSLKAVDLPPTLDPNFQNLEEQITITGIDEKGDFHPLCENTFLVASLGQSFLRIDHLGIIKKPHLFDVIKYGCLGDLKKRVNKNPSLIHKKIPMNNGNGHRNLLTIVVLACQKEFFHYLLSMGANINEPDTDGGVLCAAIKTKKLEFIEELLLLPDLDYNMQDFDGNVAAYHAYRMLLEMDRKNYQRCYAILEKIASNANPDIQNKQGYRLRDLVPFKSPTQNPEKTEIT